jgi:hypothetical protein
MNTSSKQHPKEGFQVVHKVIVFTIQRADGYKSFGIGFARRSGCIFTVDFNGEVEVDQETVVFSHSQYNISDGYISIKDLCIQKRLVS